MRIKTMKDIMLILITGTLLAAGAFAQTAVKLTNKYGAENADLQNVLFFEGISLEKLAFSGTNLKNKNYQISIKKFVDGNLAQSEVVFDSKEVEYLKIPGDQLALRVFAQVTSANTIKFAIQSEQYRVDREYKVNPDQKEFALKHFMGAQTEQSISLTENNHMLAFMMPYVKKDGWKAYCEVVQSGVSPEELGKKYAIPLYFLIDIKFS